MAETFLDRLHWHISADDYSHGELYEEAKRVGVREEILRLLEIHVEESKADHERLLKKIKNQLEIGT